MIQNAQFTKRLRSRRHQSSPLRLIVDATAQQDVICRPGCAVGGDGRLKVFDNARDRNDPRFDITGSARSAVAARSRDAMTTMKAPALHRVPSMELTDCRG
jgi:hypothetical protein